MRPFFSIMVPVYNVECYLDKCISSVLNQSYTDFELILIDDGSTDSSGEICDKYANSDERIVVVHKKNGGLISARRTAINMISGAYGIFLDSDDYLSLDALQTINDMFLQYDCDCVIYEFDRVCEGKVLPEVNKKYETVFEQIDNSKELCKRVLFDMRLNSLCRKAVRADLLGGADFAKYYGIKHGEDLLQSLEFLSECKNSVIIPDVLYHYTINPASITQTITYDNYKVDFTVRELTIDFAEYNNIFTDAELEDYKKFCAKMLTVEIIRIAMFDVNYKSKIELYEQIKTTKYYSEFLSGVELKILSKIGIIFKLFKSKHYSALIFISKLRYILKNEVKL